MEALFTPQRIASIGPNEFRRDIQRLMKLLGFEVIDVDGSGDKGADLICVKNNRIWVIQSKFKKNVKAFCPEDALDETLNARDYYNAHNSIIVSSGLPNKKLKARIKYLQNEGMDIGFWGLLELQKFWSQASNPKKWNLRKYQEDAFEKIKIDLLNNNRSLLFLATGLGKTVVSGEVIRDFIEDKVDPNILVLAHSTELISQLSASLISMLPKSINSQIISGIDKPSSLSGLTISTNLSILNYIDNHNYSPDLVVIDECHHVGHDNTYAEIIDSLPEKSKLLGVTATPWRSDEYDISNVFGPPSYTCSIEKGMKKGYLSKVDYRLLCDNINWSEVPSISENSYTIKDLNKRLFIPQRDEKIIDQLLELWNEVSKPRGIIFCQSIKHAKYFLSLLKKYNQWCDAEILHSELHKSERVKVLSDFRIGKCPLILAVDILNEGVDVPDVNIICFARVTHSRKIFVQQLGRGLRVSDNKDKVYVLDFVADIRRLFELFQIRKDIKFDEVLEYNNSGIEFSDSRAENLVSEWIKDAADLSTQNDEYKLNFPEI